nr:transposase [Streptomyces sp. P3]
MEPAPRAASNDGQAAGFVVRPVQESANPRVSALTGAKADERETLRDMLDAAPDVAASHPGQTIIGDKNYYGREFERDLAERHLELPRPARKGEAERAGAHLVTPLRQVIESINQTFKGQLDLERSGTTTRPGSQSSDHCREGQRAEYWSRFRFRLTCTVVLTLALLLLGTAVYAMVS